jgi:hypothetical protein
MRLLGLKFAWSARLGNPYVFERESLGDLVAWVKDAVRAGEIRAYQQLSTFSLRPDQEGKVVSVDQYTAAASTYATTHELSLGVPLDESKIKLENSDFVKERAADGSYQPNLARPYHYHAVDKKYATPTPDYPPDGTAAAVEARELCPPDKSLEKGANANHRSESAETAAPEVRTWFAAAGITKQTDSREDKTVKIDKWLGRDGGGGFMAGTTRVAELPPGTVLWRYFGSSRGGPGGEWWFPAPMEGDPRVFAALPEASAADRLVRATVVGPKPLTILIGMGAPRCSDKPGGPVQYMLPKAPVDTKMINLS